MTTVNEIIQKWDLESWIPESIDLNEFNYKFSNFDEMLYEAVVKIGKNNVQLWLALKDQKVIALGYCELNGNGKIINHKLKIESWSHFIRDG